MWLVPYDDLTLDQREAVTASTARHRIVLGGPGSGKTLVLAHRARYLLDEGRAESERTRVLVYTNVLREYIEAGLRDLGLTDYTQTFHSWSVDTYRSLVGSRVPRDGRYFDYERVWAQLADALRGVDEPPLDLALVDEGQDLSQNAWRVLQRSARHVTVGMDSRQQLYAEGVDLTTATQALGVRRHSAMLLSAYRCTPHIVEVASRFLLEGDERRRFLAANLLPLGERETPVIQYSDGADEEYEALASVVRERLNLGHRTAVLLPTNRQLRSVGRALAERGIETRTRDELAFDDAAPLLLTLHSAKGLTVDSVCLPTVTRRAFSGFDDDLVRNLLFVGSTRASRWLWIGTRAGREHALLDLLDDVPDSHLRRVRGSQPQAPSSLAPAPPASKPTADDDLLGLL